MTRKHAIALTLALTAGLIASSGAAHATETPCADTWHLLAPNGIDVGSTVVSVDDVIPLVCTDATREEKRAAQRERNAENRAEREAARVEAGE